MTRIVLALRLGLIIKAELLIVNIEEKILAIEFQKLQIYIDAFSMKITTLLFKNK